jgi:uncharacterized protein
MIEILPQNVQKELKSVVQTHPYPLLFATISGAHLYGFPSPNSDYDLRGVHILPLHEIAGLLPERDTIERAQPDGPIDLDLVTHDIKKFFVLLLRRNGYVLEQLLSPWVVHTTPEHQELVSLAPKCITKHHCFHYLGFAATQWKLFEKESPRRIKPLLYVFRVLLTGIHLMKTGEVQASLPKLNETAKLPYIDELVSRKLAGPELVEISSNVAANQKTDPTTLSDSDFSFYKSEYERLTSELESMHKTTHLPDMPSANAALNSLLVRIRLAAKA